MRITWIRIDNFTSIKHLDIELGDTTVFIGQNNAGNARAGEQAHRLGEDKALRFRGSLDGAKLFEGARELVSIHLDPSSTNEVEAVGCREQLRNFGGRQPITVEGDVHPEIEEGILTEARWGLTPPRSR